MLHQSTENNQHFPLCKAKSNAALTTCTKWQIHGTIKGTTPGILPPRQKAGRVEVIGVRKVFQVQMHCHGRYQNEPRFKESGPGPTYSLLNFSVNRIERSLTEDCPRILHSLGVLDNFGSNACRSWDRSYSWTILSSQWLFAGSDMYTVYHCVHDSAIAVVS